MIRVLLALLALGLAGPAVGEEAEAPRGPVVVELFTSQGCSSCPPADRLLAELVGHRDVLPLALHVDYWDYIGWEDVFADPAFTKRQKAYAHRSGERMIYTPQMVVQGDRRVAGTRPGKLFEAIAAHVDEPGPVTLEVVRDGAALRIEARSTSRFDPPLLVHMVRYAPERSVQITRGENAGHDFAYANVVSRWDTVAKWDGAAPLSLSLDAPGVERAAVLLQEPGPGLILAAARAD